MKKVAKTKKITTSDDIARKRLVAVGFWVVAFVIMILIVILIAVIEGRKSVTLDILVAPRSATIKINDEIYKNGTYHVEPGEYELSITHDELEPYYEKLDFYGGENVKLYLYLTGKDGDMSWYLKHTDDDMLLNTIGDYYANEDSKKYVASDPIFKITPHYDYNNGFRVNAARGSEGTEIIVYLYTCDENRLENLKNNAKNWLEKNQIVLDNYDLTYKYCE